MRDTAATTGSSAGVGDGSADPRDRATGVASAPEGVEQGTDRARGRAAVDGAATGDRTDGGDRTGSGRSDGAAGSSAPTGQADRPDRSGASGGGDRTGVVARSEEHTSELQS